MLIYVPIGKRCCPSSDGHLAIWEKQMSLQEFIEKNSSRKNYAHFDDRVELKEVIDEIRDPKNIVQHSFMPFIHYTLTFDKYSKKKGRYQKNRELYYSAHYDRCIYQYYAYLINEKYNEYAQNIGIDKCAIAYRNNQHKNNIHFAKEAFDFIKSVGECYIIVGDFTNFFDNLDHKYLKKQLAAILQVERLPDDFYTIYKNITHNSWVDLEDILTFYDKEDTLSNRRELNQNKKIMSIQTLRKNASLIKSKDKNIDYGIPQGSAISAVLSNVYMINFDKCLSEKIKEFGGKYFRYSDDTIFIIPRVDDMECMNVYNYIMEFCGNIPHLEMQRAKTKIYKYKNTELENKSCLIGENDNKNILEYLGFAFDGKNISLRDKTITKYYYRAYKKADTIVNCEWITGNNTKVVPHKLYDRYTLKGAKETITGSKRKYSGNFLSYLKRCRKVFGEEEKVNNIYNKHYGKIKKRLKK